MRLLGGSISGVGLFAISYGVGVLGEKHEGGHKKHSYGVGYVEEGGVVGYSCHEGWVPQGEGPGMVCVQKVKTGLLPVCPAGILEGHECIIAEPAMFSCPPGYIEVGGYGGKKDHGHGGKHGGYDEPLCMQVERAPLMPYCPAGANLLNGQCSRAEIAPATMICPLETGGGHKHHEGGKKKGHYAPPACVETIDVPALLTCAPGLELQGAMCLGSGTGPCPQTLPPPVLLDSKKGGKHGHGRGLAMIETAPMRELGKKKHEHHNEYAAPMLAPVPSKVKMCTLEIIEPAVPVCPPGSFESGNLGHHHKDKKKSHGGYMNTGLRCAQTIDIPLEPYCPMANAILDAKTMTCQSHINEQALTRCPAGFEPCDNGGKKDHGGKKHGGKKHGGKHGNYMNPDCCLANYAPPLPGCPLGAQLLGNECIIIHEPLFECPPGAIRDGEWCYIITTKPPKIHYQINVTTKQAPPVIETTKKHKHKKHH